MLVANEPATARKPSRTWKILAAGGTLGAVILLSGFGIASEPPKPEPVDVVVAAAPLEAVADDKDDKKATEAKAKADALRAKADAAQKEAQELMRAAEKARYEAEKARAEANKATKVRTIFRVDVDAKEIEKIKQEIVDAAKKGDAEGAKKAADKLARIAGNNGRTFNMTTGEPLKEGDAPLVVRGMMIAPQAQVAPAAPKPPLPPKVVEGMPLPPAAPPRVARMTMGTDSAKQAFERGMKQFKESLERVKDNPEAKAEIEKAMKAFEKSMKETMEKMPKMMEEFRMVPGAEWKFEPAMPNAEFLFVPQQFNGPGTFVIDDTKVGGGEGRLGVAIQAVPAEIVEKHGLTKGVGVQVIEVKDGSAAAKAGIKKDDILLQFAGKPVPGEPSDAVKLVSQVKKDDKVTIVVLRKGEKKEIKDVTLPDVKTPKVRVLEALGDAPQARLADLQELHGFKAEMLQKEMARIQDEIQRLHGEGAKLGGGKIEGAKSRSLSVSVNDDDVTIQADEDGVKFDIKAKKGEGVSSIKVKDGEKTVEAKSVKELPEKYRKTAESFLKSVKINND